METKDLFSLVLLLVMVGMILGVGVLTLDKYQRAVRNTGTATVAATNYSGVSEIDLAQTYCLSAVSMVNNTNAAASWDKTTYNISVTNGDDCVFHVGAFPSDMLYNFTYTYGVATASTTVALNVNTAIVAISTTWLPLIVTVAVLAIILTLVIGSFGANKR